MRKIKENISNTIIIEKSRFITNLFRVKNIEEIENIHKELKKKYYDATHNCYAYIINDGMIQKCSDDGEPSKTAGAPMLDVLKKQNLTDVFAVTTRYFGGVKLGAGGLTRAYSSSVSKALEMALLQEIKEQEIYEIKLVYQDYNRLIDYFNKQRIVKIDFNVDITIEIAFYSEEVLENINKIKNLTNGKASITYLKNEYIDVDI